ncbi:MAG: class I SAM-dependent methyltransferase [Candidatus Eisenbacteria bacterium]|nr:class I SAM-dependent methyltransferase [Candidatus Eisenbacteria bacterium]
MEDSCALITTHYAASAEGYRDWWAPVLDHLAGPTLDALPIPPGAPRLLDLGCGTGLASRRLAPRLPGNARLVAGDLVLAMLVQARQLAPSIPVVRFDAVRLPFPDCRFDLVVCTFALHHIREQRRTLGEIYRILKPGGRLQLVTWGADDPGCPAMTAWDDLLMEMGGPAEDPKAPTVWHEEIGRPAALKAMLTTLGFRSVSVTLSAGVHDFTPETLAGVRLGVGAGRRRFLALSSSSRERFESRARELLAGLAAADFVWRPDIVTAQVVKPAR